MSKSKAKSVFVCQNCGAQRPRWEGRCSDCGAWNSYVEESATTDQGPGRGKGLSGETPVTINQALEKSLSTERISTSIGELDRVLGGGLVPGSFLLLGGDPGIGKSTLLLQMAGGVAANKKNILYVSAEESIAQTGSRALRLGVKDAKIRLCCESNLEFIRELALKEKPDVVVVDSIQTVYLPNITSAPGSVSQVREGAARLMELAKGHGVTVILVGHVTKEGAIAGPKVLEHLVDTVLSFEGDRNQQFRLLRAVKNRFGATHELGVFQMAGGGLKEIKNPSELFLEERSGNPVGSTVFASVEGTRPLLCEVQALTVPTYMPMPRRTSVGVDVNRVHLLTAVLDRHAGVDLSKTDIFVNVVGGLKLEETAADLAVAAALYSSRVETSIPAKTCMFGEVGLTGEIRPVPFADLRIKEGLQLGFEKFIVPASNRKHLEDLRTEIKKTIQWVAHVNDLKRLLRTATPRAKSRTSEPTIQAADHSADGST